MCVIAGVDDKVLTLNRERMVKTSQPLDIDYTPSCVYLPALSLPHHSKLIIIGYAFLL